MLQYAAALLSLHSQLARDASPVCIAEIERPGGKPEHWQRWTLFVGVEVVRGQDGTETIERRC